MRFTLEVNVVFTSFGLGFVDIFKKHTNHYKQKKLPQHKTSDHGDMPHTWESQVTQVQPKLFT